MSAFNSYMLQNEYHCGTATWSEPFKEPFKDMLPCHGDATKADSRTNIAPEIRSLHLQPKERIKWTAISRLHYSRTVNWLLCSVSVTSANKLSSQELTQLIGIKPLILRFLEIFASWYQFPGGQCPFCLPADAHAPWPLQTCMKTCFKTSLKILHLVRSS